MFGSLFISMNAVLSTWSIESGSWSEHIRHGQLKVERVPCGVQVLLVSTEEANLVLTVQSFGHASCLISLPCGTFA